MNIFIDHVGDGHKYYRMAITSILYNECLQRRCVTKKGNVAQVEFFFLIIDDVTIKHEFTNKQLDIILNFSVNLKMTPYLGCWDFFNILLAIFF